MERRNLQPLHQMEKIHQIGQLCDKQDLSAEVKSPRYHTNVLTIIICNADRGIIDACNIQWFICNHFQQQEECFLLFEDWIVNYIHVETSPLPRFREHQSKGDWHKVNICCK